MLIGGLEAISNQMTWTWIENKGVETIRTFIMIVAPRVCVIFEALTSHGMPFLHTAQKGVSKLVDQLNSDAAKRPGPDPA